MKLEPLFSIQGNKLTRISDNQSVDPSTFKMIQISWKEVEIEDESYNEEFLAKLREELKPLDDKNQFVILCPVVDKNFETPEEIEAFIKAMNHTARRIKDCVCVAGFLLPDELLAKGIDGESPASAFMETLAVKHAQYIYFVNKKSEDKFNLNEAIFFASLVLI